MKGKYTNVKVINVWVLELMANKEYLIAYPVELRLWRCPVPEFHHVFPTEEDSLFSGLFLQVTVKESAKNAPFFYILLN